MTAQLLILDRDGVINQDSDDYIKSPDEWVPIPGSLEAIARLSHAGFRIAVATNQSGLARGLFGLETLNAIHRRLRDRVESEGGRIEMIAFCPHGPNDGCNCRKPRPGLLLEFAARFDVDLSAVPFIGIRSATSRPRAPPVPGPGWYVPVRVSTPWNACMNRARTRHCATS